MSFHQTKTDASAVADHWPDFFIVGAGKSGTTALFQHLRRHPDVFMPAFKEPNFFARYSPGPYYPRDYPDRDAYLKLFQPGRTKLRIGEASASYLLDAGAAQRIHDVAPHAKIIAILRNPVERAFSHYHMRVRTTGDTRPFLEALIADSAQQPRGLGLTLNYVEYGFYYEAIKRYLALFGCDQVRVHLYEDFESNPTEVIKDLCGFLEISFYDGRFFDPNRRYNQDGIPRNRLFKFIHYKLVTAYGLQKVVFSLLPRYTVREIYEALMFTRGPKPVLNPQAANYLHKIYDDDIRLLEGLIGRDLSAWRQSS